MEGAEKTTFMVMSDTHNIERDADLERYPIGQPTPRVDVLLHCGDLTQVGGLSAYKKALRLLGSFDAELKLVIGGNHDISLDKEYWNSHLEEDDEPKEHDQAVEIMTGPFAKEAGVTYLTEGLHSFTLQSGRTFTVYASPYQPECGDWAFGYPRTQDRFNVVPAPGMVSVAQHPVPEFADIVMTHGPPRGVLDFIPGKNEHAGCDALFHAMQRVRPLMHCFGHIHEGYGVKVKDWATKKSPADVVPTRSRTVFPSERVDVKQVGTSQQGLHFSFERGSSTLMVNAAIMDDHNEPSHAPWRIELELPIRMTCGR